MSHVSKIEIEVNDLEALKKACKCLCLEFMEGQQTYKWYGRHVGDYPLPDGFRPEDLGKCDHAIRVPGAKYEVGVVRQKDAYTLLGDFWASGGLEEHVGKDAGLLKQAYAAERVRAEARLKGFIVTEKQEEQRIRLQLRL